MAGEYKSYWDSIMGGDGLSGVLKVSGDGLQYTDWNFVPNTNPYQPPATWTWVWPDPQLEALKQQVEQLTTENTKLKNSNARLRRLLKRAKKRNAE